MHRESCRAPRAHLLSISTPPAARRTGAEGWGAIAPPSPLSKSNRQSRSNAAASSCSSRPRSRQATTTSSVVPPERPERRRRSPDRLEQGGFARRYRPDWPISNRPPATYRDSTITSQPKPPNKNKSRKTVSLTPAKTRVLTLLTTYQTLAGIGGQLRIARPTVKTHVQNIYKKLGATRRAEAVKLAESAGLLPRP